MNLRRGLNSYAKLSNQLINYGKSFMTISRGTKAGKKSTSRKFLGSKRFWNMTNICACRMGRSKHEIFSILKERIWKTINGWGGNFLSTVAREVSIKVVLQTIPSYLMGCFLLLRNVTNILHTAIRSSWWSLGSGKKMSWLSWAKFCEPKLKGGMIRYFNLALLAKQEWRLISHLDSLLSRIYKAIYFP